MKIQNVKIFRFLITQTLRSDPEFRNEKLNQIYDTSTKYKIHDKIKSIYPQDNSKSNTKQRYLCDKTSVKNLNLLPRIYNYPIDNITAKALYNSESLKILFRRKKFPEINQKLKWKSSDFECQKRNIENLKSSTKCQNLKRTKLLNQIQTKSKQNKQQEKYSQQNC